MPPAELDACCAQPHGAVPTHARARPGDARARERARGHHRLRRRSLDLSGQRGLRCRQVRRARDARGAAAGAARERRARAPGLAPVAPTPPLGPDSSPTRAPASPPRAHDAPCRRRGRRRLWVATRPVREHRRTSTSSPTCVPCRCTSNSSIPCAVHARMRTRLVGVGDPFRRSRYLQGMLGCPVCRQAVRRAGGRGGLHRCRVRRPRPAVRRDADEREAARCSHRP